jgi:hypothetical protein
MQHAKLHLSFLAAVYRNKSNAFAMPLILRNQHGRRELSITVFPGRDVSFAQTTDNSIPRESGGFLERHYFGQWAGAPSPGRL